MHWGNLSFFLPEQSPYPLAPVNDMLPMRFRPSSTEPPDISSDFKTIANEAIQSLQNIYKIAPS
ncbi:hypothetical protein SH580_04945 [Coraliomargarita algicola]|uniref:Uncharacterized protein n=1 Tax=Coraliomargarita algicola TaxID=3092156 RepID=A0ABZ0RNQ8_9BACT|nr:hypothetical protein [Coraliomargarita sp. J2-16]WPJ97051.1 hypothetical protein SH580_04945 [Coraliomargarita sp. J2-16]